MLVNNKGDITAITLINSSDEFFLRPVYKKQQTEWPRSGSVQTLSGAVRNSTKPSVSSAIADLFRSLGLWKSSRGEFLCWIWGYTCCCWVTQLASSPFIALTGAFEVTLHWLRKNQPFGIIFFRSCPYINVVDLISSHLPRHHPLSSMRPSVGWSGWAERYMVREEIFVLSNKDNFLLQFNLMMIIMRWQWAKRCIWEGERSDVCVVGKKSNFFWLRFNLVMIIISGMMAMGKEMHLRGWEKWFSKRHSLPASPQPFLKVGLFSFIHASVSSIYPCPCVCQFVCRSIIEVV